MRIPVIMYHSVGMNDSDWLWSHISISVELFESHLKVLKKRKFRSIHLSDYVTFKKQGEYKDDNLIVLTFDDGYLDNWIYVYPLLEKYGFKATIFVNPEFIDPADGVRPNLKDVWEGRCAFSDLTVPGFLSWPELKKMNDSGIIDIQSHTMTHTWYFCGDRIVDFHHPGSQNKYPWLFWNARPDKKYAYLTENQETYVPYGTPIYENGRALGVKRYFPDHGLSDSVANVVKRNGREDFFRSENWRDVLFQKCNEYKNNHTLHDRYETNEEFEQRTIFELKQSKVILESKLNKKIDYLCWPGGALTECAVENASETGYLGATVPSKIQNVRKSDKLFWIERMGCANLFKWKGKVISDTDAKFFLNSIGYFQGKGGSLFLMRLKKLYYLFKHALGFR